MEWYENEKSREDLHQERIEGGGRLRRSCCLKHNGEVVFAEITGKPSLPSDAMNPMNQMYT